MSTLDKVAVICRVLPTHNSTRVYNEQKLINDYGDNEMLTRNTTVHKKQKRSLANHGSNQHNQNRERTFRTENNNQKSNQ